MAMTAKAKNILSSLYETKGIPYGRVYKWLAALHIVRSESPVNQRQKA
ncbi:MAG: hypothetical protein ACFNUH_02170 [Bacteroidota bacterium]